MGNLIKPGAMALSLRHSSAHHEHQRLGSGAGRVSDQRPDREPESSHPVHGPIWPTRNTLPLPGGVVAPWILGSFVGVFKLCFGASSIGLGSC